MSQTLTAAPTATPTTPQMCANQSWPAVGRACDVLAGGCLSYEYTTSVPFDEWHVNGAAVGFAVRVRLPTIRIRPEAVNLDPHTHNGTSERKVKPEYVSVGVSSGNVTADVFAETVNGSVVLRVSMRRVLGGDEATVGVTSRVGLLLSPTVYGVLSCILPFAPTYLDLPDSSAAGLLLLIGPTVLFEPPPPLSDEGTRKAAGTVSSVATVASVAAGPMAADVQALAALGSLRCSPGGGDATGDNGNAMADNVRSLSLVAFDSTCHGALIGDFVFLGGFTAIHFAAVLAVLMMKKRSMWGAMAMVRFPSLTFVMAASLQTGLIVCGYQVIDTGLGAVGFVAGVALPVIPVVVLLTVVSRRRYRIQFPALRPRRPFGYGVDEPRAVPCGGCEGRLVDVMLPTTSLDGQFHPIGVAFSTFVGRNRLPHAVWGCLPYLTPLALLPAVVAPISACVPLIVVSALAYFALAAVMFVVRPQSILLSNISGGAALVVNGMLTAGSAALIYDPSSTLARSVISAFGSVQTVASGIRLGHGLVASGVLPVMMTLRMLQRPYNVSPLPPCDPDEFPQPSTAEVDPVWTVYAPCAPTSSEEDSQRTVAEGLLQDVLFAVDSAGPTVQVAEAFAPPSDSTPSETAAEPLSSEMSEVGDEDDHTSQLRDPSNSMAFMHSTAEAIRHGRSKRAKFMLKQGATKKSLYYFIENESSNDSI